MTAAEASGEGEERGGGGAAEGGGAVAESGGGVRWRGTRKLDLDLYLISDRRPATLSNCGSRGAVSFQARQAQKALQK